MLIKITEENGLETYVFEPRVPVAFTMLKYFEGLGLQVQSMTDYEPLYMGIGLDYEQNLRREINYKKEFEKFDKSTKLHLVK